MPAILLLIATALTLPAQTTFGRITGEVTDPTGASVPNATVIIRNTDTQAKREIHTDERGYYSVENLPIGPYRVEVDHPGFKRSGQTDTSSSPTVVLPPTCVSKLEIRRKAWKSSAPRPSR